jgi:hypothetical protein
MKRTRGGSREWLSAHGWLIATVGVFVITLVATVALTARPKATNLENGLFEFVLFLAGVAFSFYSGRRSIQAAASEVLRPHGKKSVRRLLHLAAGLQKLYVVIDRERTAASEVAENHQGSLTLVAVNHHFDVIQGHIEGELRTVGDALDDWRDVVPEDVESVEQKGAVYDG